MRNRNIYCFVLISLFVFLGCKKKVCKEDTKYVPDSYKNILPYTNGQVLQFKCDSTSDTILVSCKREDEVITMAGMVGPCDRYYQNITVFFERKDSLWYKKSIMFPNEIRILNSSDVWYVLLGGMSITNLDELFREEYILSGKKFNKVYVLPVTINSIPLGEVWNEIYLFSSSGIIAFTAKNSTLLFEKL